MKKVYFTQINIEMDPAEKCRLENLLLGSGPDQSLKYVCAVSVCVCVCVHITVKVEESCGFCVLCVCSLSCVCVLSPGCVCVPTDPIKAVRP